MSTPWIIAVVSLWVLLCGVGLGVVALARQVGLLHLRVQPVGIGHLSEGPVEGAHIDPPPLTTLRGRPAELLTSDDINVVLFASPTCGLCKPVLEGARQLAKVEPLALTVAVDGAGTSGLSYALDAGFEDAVAASELPMLDAGSRPFAVGLTKGGLVLAAGAINTLYQLEGLVDLSRKRRDEPVETEGTDPQAIQPTESTSSMHGPTPGDDTAILSISHSASQTEND